MSRLFMLPPDADNIDPLVGGGVALVAWLVCAWVYRESIAAWLDVELPSWMVKKR